MEETTLQRVSSFVGRELTPGEVATYPDFDTLPTEATNLVAVLVMNHCAITAARYLCERVPGCNRREIEERLERHTEAWMSRWSPADERELRAVLGRELRPEETATFEGDMPPSVKAVLLKLAARDFTLACKYLLQRRVLGIYLYGAVKWVEKLLASRSE